MRLKFVGRKTKASLCFYRTWSTDAVECIKQSAGNCDEYPHYEVYVRIREIMHTNTDLVAKINALDGKVAGQDEKILRLFNYMQQFNEKEKTPRRKVGYK